MNEASLAISENGDIFKNDANVLVRHGDCLYQKECIASFNRVKKACNMRRGKGRVRTQDLGDSKRGALITLSRHLNAAIYFSKFNNIF